MAVDDDEFVCFAGEASARLHNLALALSGNSNDADDLVQATLERLYRTWRTRTPDDPGAYARTVLVHTHISLRRRVRWRREISTAHPEDWSGSAEGATDTRLELQKALACLPPRQRHAVVLRYLEDLPIAEVASLMRCSEGNVKRCAYDGLVRLRQLLETNPQGATR